jgi:hypothetical protein
MAARREELEAERRRGFAAAELRQGGQVLAAARAQFRRDGFLKVRGVLGEERAVALRERFAELFAGRFATGV